MAHIGTWIKTHQRVLTLVAVALGVVLLGLAGLLLWRRFPAFRAAMLTALGTATALIAAARTARPVMTPTPEVVIETVEPALENGSWTSRTLADGSEEITFVKVAGEKR